MVFGVLQILPVIEPLHIASARGWRCPPDKLTGNKLLRCDAHWQPDTQTTTPLQFDYIVWWQPSAEKFLTEAGNAPTVVTRQSEDFHMIMENYTRVSSPCPQAGLTVVTPEAQTEICDSEF